MESLLLRLLIGLIIVGVAFALIRLVLPQLGLPAWVTTAVLLVLGALVIIWLLLTLVPLMHAAL